MYAIRSYYGYFWATHSQLPAIIKVAKTLKDHWNGIINYFEDRFSNGLLEGLNSMIQALKANARGYRNDENFMTMIYLRVITSYSIHYTKLYDNSL